VLNLVFIEAQAGYLELEFCEQGHLWQWLERAPPRTFGERVAVLQQALRGLEHVHRAGVVHCDVKPENIFVSGAGVAKLADFDVSKDDATRVTLHSSATVVGRTLPYLAPELSNLAQRATPASDLFAFGLTLFDVLTASERAIKRMVAAVDAKQLALVVDSSARAAVQALTSTEPSKRPTATVALSLPLFRSASASVAAVPEQPQPQHAHARDDVERLRQDLIDKLIDCCVCMDAPKDCVVSPCRHVAMCVACAESVIQCPICNGPVDKREKVFLS
jgi:serine/threonine protein kinase